VIGPDPSVVGVHVPQDLADGGLILQGDDDQIVPFADAGQLQAKLVKGATLKVYKGAPHGMCTTHKDEVSADLLAFIGRNEGRKAA
jgi:non-heme chloroperoxidase